MKLVDIIDRLENILNMVDMDESRIASDMIEELIDDLKESNC